MRKLTEGPKHHFFGYYGICPWNKSQTHLLSLETDFQDHMPGLNDAAGIGLVDNRTGRYEKITETKAWNFQQGAFMHWNPLKPDSEILYNDRIDNEIVSIFFDINSGKKRILPRPVNGISHNGKYALSLTYGRLGRMRKVVSYANVVDPYKDEAHPDKDGVFVMDLQTGETKLAVSINQVYEKLKDAHPELENLHIWFNHTVFNKNDTRFFLLARTRKANEGEIDTGMFTAGIDGSDLREVIPYGTRVSHFDWRNNREIIATFNLDSTGRRHYHFVDGVNEYKRLGKGSLDFDGHCTFSPDQKWIATDRKVRANLEQSIILYNFDSDTSKTLATFSMKEKRFISGELRCDFHPRWNWDGTAICFDAIDADSGLRQMHLVEFTDSA
ncbi:MAG: hypothetical protein ABFS38_14105 [Bacteroidota bacterium]